MVSPVAVFFAQPAAEPTLGGPPGGTIGAEVPAVLGKVGGGGGVACDGIFGCVMIMRPGNIGGVLGGAIDALVIGLGFTGAISPLVVMVSGSGSTNGWGGAPSGAEGVRVTTSPRSVATPAWMRRTEGSERIASSLPAGAPQPARAMAPSARRSAMRGMPRDRAKAAASPRGGLPDGRRTGAGPRFLRGSAIGRLNTGVVEKRSSG